MNETHVTLDRLEARLDAQEARIEALYGMLELRGLLPRPVGAGRGDALHDEDWESPDLAPARQETRAPAKRRARRMRVGTATGV